MHVPYVGLAVLALAYAALGLVDRTAWHPLVSIVGLGLAGTGYGLGFSPMMTVAVAGVPPQRARDASGIITTAIQVSYAVGLTALGNMFLGRAQLPGPHASGHAFATVSIVLAMLSLAAAMLAASIARRAGALRAPKLLRGPLRRLAYRRTAG
jgi:hypothetical protein